MFACHTHVFVFAFAFFTFSNRASAQSSSYCKKYNGNHSDFIDCCITLFPEINGEDDNDQTIKFTICDDDNECGDYKCVMKEQGQLTEDYQLNKSAIINKAMMDKEDSVWQAIIDTAYSKCVKIATAKNERCMHKVFSECFDTTTFLECPKSEWNNTASCNEARNYIKNCRVEF